MSHEPPSESVTNAVRVVSDGYEQKLATLQTGFETAHELWVQERDRAIQMEGALASEKRAVKARDETIATLTAERDQLIEEARGRERRIEELEEKLDAAQTTVYALNKDHRPDFGPYEDPGYFGDYFRDLTGVGNWGPEEPNEKLRSKVIIGIGMAYTLLDPQHARDVGQILIDRASQAEGVEWLEIQRQKRESKAERDALRTALEEVQLRARIMSVADADCGEEVLRDVFANIADVAREALGGKS